MTVKTMVTADLLKKANIATVVVVDDALDPDPTPADMSLRNDEWEQFAEDAPPYADFLEEIAPGSTNRDAGPFRENEMLINALWNKREEQPELCEPLFRGYIADQDRDLGYIDTLTDALEKAGLNVIKAGRDFGGLVEKADLIVIDLFFGDAQEDPDMQESMNTLKLNLRKQEKGPPAVLLMSRSSRLAEKQGEFRQTAKLHASGFKTVQKHTFEKTDRIEFILRMLARHRQDSLRLANFVNEWSNSVTSAVSSTVEGIMRLDLEDIAQLRALSLNAEGTNTSSYMLDMFDRILQYDIEANDNVVAAALSLDEISVETFPPLSIPSERDASDLLVKSSCIHPVRCAMDTGSFYPVQFGDIIVCRDRAAEKKGGLFTEDPDRAFIVVSPACDLQRGKTPRAVLMVGQMQEPIIGTYHAHLTTPVVDIPSIGKRAIKWDATHIRSFSETELKLMLSKEGNCRLGARLRGVQAISLQQQMLGKMGRVGDNAPPPQTRAFTARVYYSGKDGKPVEVPLADVGRIEGNAFYGRVNEDNHELRYVLGSDFHFSLLEALSGIDPQSVHANSRAAFEFAIKPEILEVPFTVGLTTKNKNGSFEEKMQVGTQNRTIYTIRLHPDRVALLQESAIAKAGLIFEVEMNE